MKFRTISYSYGYTKRDGTDARRTFRATEVDGTIYAYERSSGYDVFTLRSFEPDENNVIQIEQVLMMGLPNATAAKLAIRVFAAGLDPTEHQAGQIEAHLAGGGWGGWARSFRATPECRTCGRLTEEGDDSVGTVAEAREIAWDHWQEDVEKKLKAVEA